MQVNGLGNKIVLATASAECKLDHEGVWCDVGAHEAQDRAQAPLQTKLLAYSSHADEAKEWFYYPDASDPPATPDEGQHQRLEHWLCI